MNEILPLMRALADPTRLRIVLLIRRMELSIGEIVQILDQSQPRVSRHVRILDEAKVTERRKEGSWVFLRPGSALMEEGLDQLFDDVGPIDGFDPAEDFAQLEKVRLERARMAERYFAEHAEEWDQLRSMHVADQEVEKAMQNILSAKQLGRVLDVGTGTGRMMELFAPQSDHYTALDNNSEMLRIARAKLANMPQDNVDADKVEILLGDFNALPFADDSFDTILFHQVLHYAQAPEAVIAEASRVLRPGGRIVIVDFAAHDREELRSIHAHARLGFTDQLINRSFVLSGIRLAHEQSLEGGELAVKIWLGRDERYSGNNPENTKLRIVA